MSDWTAGYVADIGYTYGYYSELNPLRVKLAFLSAGLVCPQFGTACELGFGQGVSTNIHAAASVTQWYGTDFNPAQAGFAQELAVHSSASATLYDESFEEFARRSELPEFDFICLHGIWSWISDENRAVVVDFIRRKLKVGGVLYLSYNTMPGWAAFAPMRHLLNQHADIMGATGEGIANRIGGALEFAEELMATNPLYVRANPTIGERIKTMKQHGRDYLAHEYFNRDWHPMHFATAAEWLAPAKVQFACSAHFHDHVGVLSLSKEQSDLLARIPDPQFRESVRDFMVNQQFRRDYWVRGRRTISALEKLETLRALKVVLLVPPDEVPLSIKCAAGQVSLSEAVYLPILAQLAQHEPTAVGVLEQALADKGIALGAIEQSLMVLGGLGVVVEAQDQANAATVRESCNKLNKHVLSMSRYGGELSYLASPVLGGGMPLDRVNQHFLLGCFEGLESPAQLARFAWEIMTARGHLIAKDGVPLQTAEENVAELEARAAKFLRVRLPILKKLQIA